MLQIKNGGPDQLDDGPDQLDNGPDQFDDGQDQLDGGQENNALHMENEQELHRFEEGGEQEDEHGNENDELSNDHILALVMAFVIKHKITGVCLTDLLKLLNTLIPGCVPKTKYFIDKTFFSLADAVEYHHYCDTCQYYLGTQPDRCTQCNVQFDMQKSIECGSYFITTSIKSQLKDLFENHNLQEHLVTDRYSQNYCDVFDGDLYKSHNGFFSNPDNLSFNFNTDGVPVFSSSKFSIWPVLLSINEVKLDQRSDYVMLHSLWFGKSKPLFDVFLQPFITEMNDLFNNGVDWKTPEGNIHVSKCAILISSVDTIARCSLQGLKQFNGEYGCGFCLHKGQYLQEHHKRVYEMVTPQPGLRFHDQMLNHAEETVNSGSPVFGVKRVSSLFLLDGFFDMVNSFIPDYMHAVLLGVVRAVVNLMFDTSSHDSPYYLLGYVGEIDEELLSMTPPKEITRSPRSLQDRAYWKANEWRAFLLFYSPILFQSRLPAKYYHHWLLLVNGISRLLSSNISPQMIIEAQLCLTKFVVGFPELYGLQNCSYNVHLLTHLPDTVRKWGPLWATSAFVFEDMNGTLLSMFHGTQAVSSQIVKNFLGYRNVLKFGNRCMVNAPEHVSALFLHFTNRKASRHIQNVHRIANKFTLLGAPKQYILPLQSCTYIEDKVGMPVVRRDIQCHDRFIANNKLITTCSYSRKFKRDNSAIEINGKFYVVEKCVTGKLFCECDQVCGCDVTTFILCRSLNRVVSQSRLYDDYVEVDLRRYFQKFKMGLLCAFNVKDIRKKVVLLKRDQVNYVIQMPILEID